MRLNAAQVGRHAPSTLVSEPELRNDQIEVRRGRGGGDGQRNMDRLTGLAPSLERRDNGGHSGRVQELTVTCREV